MNDGWMVHFGDHDIDLENCLVRVPREKLVIGLANGWANDGKFVYIDPRLIKQAYRDGLLGNRGFAFWNIKDEGLEVEVDSIHINDTESDTNFMKEERKEKVKCIMAEELKSIFE